MVIFHSYVKLPEGIMSANMFERETALSLLENCGEKIRRNSMGHLDVAVPPAAPRNGAAKMHSAHTSAM